MSNKTTSALIKANRRIFDYLEPELTGYDNSRNYLCFLQKHLLHCNPYFYCVLSKKQINTQDGIMYAVKIGFDINDPNYEPIAECWINGQLLYFWRDYCWTIAVDDEGNSIGSEIRNGEAVCKIQNNSLKYRTEAVEKILILHHVSNHKLSETSIEIKDE